MKDLSAEQAFRAMGLFLENYFERTGYDELGFLLTDLQILDDGKPLDPAAWEDWLACVERILREHQTTDRDNRS